MNPEQKNLAVNDAIGCVFFEDTSLVFNYKTKQWVYCPALSGAHLFSISSTAGIVGRLIQPTTVTYGITDQTSGVVQTGIVETSERDINPGGRAVVDAVRPLMNGGTASVRVGVRNNLTDAVTYSTGTALNSRTGMANFRAAENKAEGRYQRLRLHLTDFTTALGADVEFSGSGKT